MYIDNYPVHIKKHMMSIWTASLKYFSITVMGFSLFDILYPGSCPDPIHKEDLVPRLHPQGRSRAQTPPTREDLVPRLHPQGKRVWWHKHESLGLLQISNKIIKRWSLQLCSFKKNSCTVYFSVSQASSDNYIYGLVCAVCLHGLFQQLEVLLVYTYCTSSCHRAICFWNKIQNVNVEPPIIIEQLADDTTQILANALYLCVMIPFNLHSYTSNYKVSALPQAQGLALPQAQGLGLVLPTKPSPLMGGVWTRDYTASSSGRDLHVL